MTNFEANVANPQTVTNRVANGSWPQAGQGRTKRSFQQSRFPSWLNYAQAGRVKGEHMIIMYRGLSLSLEDALSHTDDEYHKAYQWFLAHEGQFCARPFGKNRPTGISISLAAQRGIHKPAGYSYAISVTSSDNATYAADEVSHLDDGTWLFEYCAHRRNAGEREGSPVYNRSLVKCLEAGLPVGVFVKVGGAYRCLGLAFVERFDTENGMFTLHGPVRSGQELEYVSPSDLQALQEEILTDARRGDYAWDALAVGELGDSADSVERERKLAEVIRRKKQASFRAQLIEAYGGRCAATGYGVSDALQAAHIASYYGPKSQVVTNGLLLRADIHLLYDRFLLSVEPDSLRIEMDAALSESEYGELRGRRITVPADRTLRPSYERLSAQYDAVRQARGLRAGA